MNFPTIYKPVNVEPENLPENDGLGALSSATSCVVEQDGDNTFELEMTYPASGNHANEIRPERLLRVNLDRMSHGTNQYRQFFRITSVEKKMSSSGESLQVHAEHLSCDLKWYWCKPAAHNSQNPADAFSAIKNGQLSWSPFTSKMASQLATSTEYKLFKFEEPFSVREGLITLASLYNGYIFADNFNVTLMPLPGIETGYVFEKGKNLSELSVVNDATAVILGTDVYYYDGEKYYGTTAVSVEDYSTKASLYGAPRFVPLNYHGSHSFGEFSAPADTTIIKDIGTAYLRNETCSEPNITISAKVADVDGAKFAVHDVVTVRHSGFGVDEKAEIQKIRYDALRARFQSIEVGTPSLSLAAMIANTPKG